MNIEKEIVRRKWLSYNLSFGYGFLPNKSGVYLFIIDGICVYVGQAKNIRERVGCHLHYNNIELGKKNLVKVKFVSNSDEKSILEARFIKRLAPLYNKMLHKTTEESIVVRKLNIRHYHKIPPSELSTSEKITKKLIEIGKSEDWLFRKTWLNRREFDSNMKFNSWSVDEIIFLHKLLNID